MWKPKPARPPLSLTREEFAHLYDEYFEYLLRFILPRVAGNRVVAEDLLQETFLAALQSPSFTGKSQARTWFCGIAKHKIADHYRREIRQQDWVEVENHLSAGTTESAESLFYTAECREDVVQTLSKLNPVYRWALILKYIDGYNMKEIGALLERTPKAVDSILQRARSAFTREYLAQSKGGSSR